MAFDWAPLTDEEIAEEIRAGMQEQTRRYNLATIPGTVNTMNADYLAASGVAEGDAWVQPKGAHDAYPLDWTATHKSKTWISTVMSNVWEPGVSGWAGWVQPGSYPDWVQPTGGHDAYAKGAEVLHNAKHWRSDIDANVWEPGVYGWTEFAP